jgi:hypothetical protein
MDQDDLAQAEFGQQYSTLIGTRTEEVDNVFFNIMSYHGNRFIFTTLQLDAMCDSSNLERDGVSHNEFIFVDPLSPGISADGQSQILPFGGPFAQLRNAIDDANGGDVLLLRPGNYTEDRIIRKAITLRAVRRDGLTPGNAIVRAR